MKYYKVSKSKLKWKDIQQLDYPWKMPILIDKDLNVIAGNSLKDSLPSEVIVVVCHNYQREFLFQCLYEIEEKIALENSHDRLNTLQMQVREFFKQVMKPKIETVDLFTIEEHRCITPERYIEPPPYDFNKHRNIRELFNEGNLLLEEFLELEKIQDEPEIEIDMEILKELL